MTRISKQRRFLQFLEAMNAAAAAYHSLHHMTKCELEQRLPDLGRYLYEISEGLSTGTCEALEAEGRRLQARDRS